MRKILPVLLLGLLIPPVQARELRVHALQPRWNVSDYGSDNSFQKWMQAQLTLARVNFDPDHPNLVVLTELNGLPLALRGSRLAQQAPSLQLALAASLLKHLPESLHQAMVHKVDVVRGLMLALAPENMQLYLRTCAELAREHGVYLLCGSAVHAHLQEVGGQVQLEGPELYNQAVLIGPDGKVLGAWDKVHLTADEGPLGMIDGKLQDLVTVSTPVGDIGVATSLDAFKQDVIGQLEKTGTTVFLQPDANAALWTGEEHGTSTHRPQPEAWLDSSWSVVQKSPTIRYAVNPMVVGNLFDVGFDGQSAIIGKAEAHPQKQGYVLTEPRGGFIALMPWAEAEWIPPAGWVKSCNRAQETPWKTSTRPEPFLLTSSCQPARSSPIDCVLLKRPCKRSLMDRTSRTLQEFLAGSGGCWGLGCCWLRSDAKEQAGKCSGGCWVWWCWVWLLSKDQPRKRYQTPRSFTLLP